MGKIVFTEQAWQDYLYWQGQDKKTLRRINQLLQDISRNGYTGIGKPEPLKHDLTGYWSRRIDEVNRLVYRITGDTRTLQRLNAKEAGATDKREPQLFIFLRA